MRAAEHIVYQSDNTVSDKFEDIVKCAVEDANDLIEKTGADISTLKEMRKAYGQRMSKSFAFLRDISVMSREMERITDDISNFDKRNKWREYSEIPSLFKNLDVLRMQEAVGTAILYTAKEFGSRGSGFVLDGGDFMDRRPIEENAAGRERIVTVSKNGCIGVDCISVRPIPERDLWFEKVWNKYNEIRG